MVIIINILLISVFARRDGKFGLCLRKRNPTNVSLDEIVVAMIGEYIQFVDRKLSSEELPFAENGKIKDLVKTEVFVKKAFVKTKNNSKTENNLFL